MLRDVKFNTCLEGELRVINMIFYHVRHSIIFVPLNNHKNDKIILQIIILLKKYIYTISDTKCQTL